MTDSKYPAVIGLNGPPHSGKTHLTKFLVSVIPSARVLFPSVILYTMMQEDGLAPSKVPYHEFKKRQDSRGRLIEASHRYRWSNPNVFERRIVESPEYCNASVVIIDNVGHVPDEMQFYDRHSTAAILLRLDTPFQEIEPLKSRARRLKAAWQDDSRTPLEHHTMLTAYDSQQMILLLQWLSGPLTREEAGPYYGIKSFWTRYFAAGESSQGIRRDRTAGELGGLGQAIGLLPGSS